MRKTDVRAEARQRQLPVADKKDSQGVCFIGEIEMNAFLKTRLKTSPGKIVTTSGREIGEHEGLPFYTIGQRKGIGVGGGTPYYVVEKRRERNELVVSSNFDAALYETSLTAGKMNWLIDPKEFFSCSARIRYRQPLEECAVKILDSTARGRISVTFNEPQRAVTPGQFVVLYDGDVVLGGGMIE
jgi:tRNA-specific 2-thiouridylase